MFKTEQFSRQTVDAEVIGGVAASGIISLGPPSQKHWTAMSIWFSISYLFCLNQLSFQLLMSF